MEDERFAAALQAAAYDMGCKGIGTMREKTLHIALKHYFAPDASCHELPVGGFIADAVTEDGVFEIQTHGLSRLKEKLTAFLAVCPVTVVHPIANPKWLYTVDENGVLLSKRKSPKHESPYTAMREIYSLREFVTNPRFSICLAAVETAEYRQKSPRKGVRGEKLDRVPTALHGLRMLSAPSDYLALLPVTDLPEVFSARDAAALMSAADEGSMRMLLLLLERLGVVESAGKSGNRKLWRLTELYRSDAIRG